MMKHLATLAFAAVAVAACGPTTVSPHRSKPRSWHNSTRWYGLGAVYTITNQVAGNAVAVFARSADGTLTPAGTFATGGAGTGAGLGSQGAVTLSDDGRLLFAVNAGSNDVSVFQVGPQGPSLLSRTPSAARCRSSGHSRAERRVRLESGAPGNITGFTLLDRRITPIAGSDKVVVHRCAAAQCRSVPTAANWSITEKSTA